MTGAWQDGGPLDPPERGDYETAVERARAAQAECPACSGPTVDVCLVEPAPGRAGTWGLRCAAGVACEGGGWEASDEDLVESWVESQDARRELAEQHAVDAARDARS